MATWDDVLTARDKEVFAKAGFGKRAGFGQRPAVLVIDVNYAFVGDRPEPILDSVKKFRHSCGQEGWDAVYRIRDLLSGAHDKRLPIFYTTSWEESSPLIMGRWRGKNGRSEEDLQDGRCKGTEIVGEVAAQEGDVLIRKQKPSAFFGTPLISMLHELAVDTLLVTGCTTSGCVRASVVDAFSYNFRVSVVEECVFDRGEASHKINLFDMNAKYADVISLNDALEYVSTLPKHLYGA